MTVVLFKDEEIRKWIRTMPPEFEEWMEEQFTEGIAKLMRADDLRVVGRFQGILEILAMLRELRKRSRENGVLES